MYKFCTIQRGDSQAYKLTPVTDQDMYFTPDMVEKLRESIQQIKDGQSVTFATVHLRVNDQRFTVK